MRERFLREARAAAAVSHPHICQLFDIGEHDGEPFLCMELLDGQSLADRLSGGPMPVPEAATTQLAILSALAALHRRGIVHRDLKPTNIFLTGQRRQAARFRPRPIRRAMALDETAVTMPGIVMGSPRYMAPEQVRGEDVDPRAGHLRRRSRAVRDVERQGGLRRDLGGRCAPRGGARPSAGADGIPGGGRHGPGHPAGRGEGARGSLPERRRHGDRRPRRAVARRRGGDGAGACDQAAGRAAVQGAQAGSGRGLPGVQPARRDHRVALGPRLADGSIEPRRGAVQRRGAGPAGGRVGAQRRGGDHRHVAARGQGRARRGAARRSALGYRPLVAHRPGGARRSVHDPGLGLFRGRGCLRAEADPEGTRGAAAGRARQPGGVRALPARQPAEHERHAVGAGAGISTRAPSRPIRRMRRRGRGSDASSATSASTGAPRTRAPSISRRTRRFSARSRSIPSCR